MLGPLISSETVLEELIVAEYIKKFSAFYGTKSFFCHVHNSSSLGYIVSQLNPVHTFTSYVLFITILILSSHLFLDLASGIFPSGFQIYMLFLYVYMFLI
jgi:hypothetical protein